MIESLIRSTYQKILVDPIAKSIQSQVSPNQISILSGCCGCLFMPALQSGHSVLAIVLLLFSGFFDTLDGTIARLKNLDSAWGSILDIMIDRLVEIVVIFTLWLVAPNIRSLGIILMLSSIILCVSSFLVVGIFSQNITNKSFDYSPGLMERAEAFIFFIVMILLPDYFNWVAMLFSSLVIITAIIRLFQFYRYYKRRCCATI